MVIRTPDQRLRVFVSSTLGELAPERRAVARAVSALRLTPVMFELGARPQPPREVYRAYLAQSDVFVGLYWQRYGQVAPAMQVSGLEEEFELSAGLPRLVYVKAPAPGREPRLADLLSRVRQQASYRTAGSLDTALGRYDDALRHLRQARDLAERSGGDWLAAGSRVQLSILDVLRGRLDEAQPLLDEALDLSLAARSTPFVTLCLTAYAWLAIAEGNPERAALLEGAAEGLRRRVGLSAWPHLRRVETDLVAKIRRGLGASQYDQAFSTGSRLTQRQQ